MQSKILIATGIYPPSVGGPATYSFLLFHELPKAGVETEVYSFDSVRHLPRGIRHIQYFFGVFKRGLRASIIYAQDPVSVGLPSYLAALILRKLFIIRIAGDYAWEQAVQRYNVKDILEVFAVRQKPYPLFVRLLKKIQLFVASHADKVIVPSQYLKNILSKWGINPRKIKVIYNSIDIPALEDKEVLRRKFNLEGCVILSAGRLVPWKGFDALIELMPELLKKDPCWFLFIVGDGPHRPELKRLIAKFKLDDYVFLIGRLPREEMLEFVKASDVFVLNSAYEGFSHLALEVMAVGTPLITTFAGGNKELIDNNRDGILVEHDNMNALRDSIIRIKKDKMFAVSLAQNAEIKLRTFSKERMIGELVAELRESL